MSHNVMRLAEAFVGYRGLGLEEVAKILLDSIIIRANGDEAIELAIFEKKIGLPDGYFQSILKEEAPVAPTTEASEIIG